MIGQEGVLRISRALEPGGLPAYQIADTQLEAGSSVGNRKCCIDTKGTGEIEHLFSVELGMEVVGALALRYARPGRRLALPRPGDSERAEPHPEEAYSLLTQERPGTFTIHPAYQAHSFEFPPFLDVHETVFTQKTGSERDQSIVYARTRLSNRSDHVMRPRVYAYCQLRGRTPTDLESCFNADLNALMAWNKSHPDWVRIFGASCPVSGYTTTHDVSRVYEPSDVFSLDADVSCTGDLIGVLQVDLALNPGDSREVTFMVAFSAEGEAKAIAQYRASPDPSIALSSTEAYLQERLSNGQVMTPDPVINDGALWAKVNMLRVMSDYPQGQAFTNDPTRSSNVVARDACWFIYGCDHLLPAFSRGLLDGMAARQKPDGMIVEYWNAVSGDVDDYGLNINDNTPLFILALNHHWRATGDRAYLEQRYDAAARAARHIIGQEDERGLVVSRAHGTELYGIASWRNIIPDYQINGAVTEINAECVAALRAMGHLAENLGRDEASQFFAEGEKLKAALNRHLLNPHNGMYYLNVDLDGNLHTDVTADEVFPVIFRVAPEDVAFRIISRLNSPDFMTDAGIRTVSRASLDYTPDRDWGLRGGVWPGVTWWYAFAAAGYHPEFMVAALRASFQHYNRDPQSSNTVPGQFSEWFDGESLVNRGMRLSPWEPPRFLWAAVEGICGVMLKPDRITVRPLIPKDWKWVALQRLPYHGSPLTFFAGRWPGDTMCLFTDGDIHTEHRIERYEREITAAVQVENGDVHHLVLERPSEIIVCLGNTFLHTSIAQVRLHDVLPAGSTYVVDVYNSERGGWTNQSADRAANLHNLTVSIEAGGYRVIRLRQEGAEHSTPAER